MRWSCHTGDMFHVNKLCSWCKTNRKKMRKTHLRVFGWHLNSSLLLLQSIRRCDKLKYCPGSDLMGDSVLPCAWGKPGKLAASFLKAGNGCQGIWKGYSAMDWKLLWDHPAEQLCEKSELGFGVSQCRRILRLLLLWWWQWWLLLSVSFPSGLCLGGSLFSLVCKATSSQYPKPPGTEKCLFLHQKQVSFLLTECFSLEKNNSEFRSCLHLFRIVNRISTVL